MTRGWVPLLAIFLGLWHEQALAGSRYSVAFSAVISQSVMTGTATSVDLVKKIDNKTIIAQLIATGSAGASASDLDIAVATGSGDFMQVVNRTTDQEVYSLVQSGTDFNGFGANIYGNLNGSIGLLESAPFNLTLPDGEKFSISVLARASGTGEQLTPLRTLKATFFGGNGSSSVIQGSFTKTKRVYPIPPG